MDPFSQGLIGATAASTFSNKKTLKIAAITGCFAGLMPDLDVLISSHDDPLFSLEYHRHFTHSLFFVPIGGFIAASLIWLVYFRKKKPFKQILFFAVIGFGSHGLLDAMTAYGTLLLWPISDYRFTFNAISIIDPIFTFTTFMFLILAVIKNKVKLARIAAIFAITYLAFGLFNQFNVENKIKQIAKTRNHNIERSFFNPTIGNIFLWRSIYQYNNNYYIDAVRIIPFKSLEFKEGEQTKVINIDNIYPFLTEDSIQKQDIKRFSKFSKDYIYQYPNKEYIISDLRYGIFPYDLRGLWGIKISPETQDEHVKFIYFRAAEERNFKELLSLIFDGFDKK